MGASVSWALPTLAPPMDLAHPPLVELGWMTVGRLDDVDVRAVEAAKARMLAYFQETFPSFQWSMPLVRRDEVEASGRVEPVLLIDHAIIERDVRQWDYALVITGADLKSYDKPFTLGTPSRAVSVAALSTLRIDPAATSVALGEDQRHVRFTQRLYALALHLVGHLAGLPHSATEGEEDVMCDVQAVSDLDTRRGYAPEAVAALHTAFADVADLRLEEAGFDQQHPVVFYGRVLRQNGYEIAAAVAAIRPWQFPFRLSRLTTAAVSTMLVLVTTAEAWELGMSQSPAFVALLSLTALAGTTYYTLHRQALFIRRRSRRLSEQRAISNLSVTLAVAFGMATTYALLFAGTFTLGSLLFNAALVEGWAASIEGAIGARHYLVLSGFVALLGITIGALGASFEEQGYVRHVAFVDEET